jgi:YidC/Oxa1 family membrane protein insertase
VLKFLRECRDFARLLEQPSGPSHLVAYAEDIATWAVLGPYLDRFAAGRDAAALYVTSAPDDPRLAAPPAGVRSAYLSMMAPYWMGRVRAGAFFTTMPDLGRLQVPRPPATTPTVYAFHSLISTHEGYRPGAFDHYDVFFCAGPHHRRELEAHFGQIGRPLPRLVDVGYAKLDRLAERFAARARRPAAQPTVLVAPSWAKGNVLEAAGVEVVERVRAIGARVIVRPHPCFWLPIYPEGRHHVQRIIDRFAADPEVVVERNINSEDAFLDADLLISDFSGAAYEYAFATRRPVLFFDGARKTLNPAWQSLGLATFEDVMRREVGELIAPGQVAEVGRVAERLLHDAPAWSERLGELCRQHVYNFGRSADVGAAALRDVIASGRA